VEAFLWDGYLFIVIQASPLRTFLNSDSILIVFYGKKWSIVLSLS